MPRLTWLADDLRKAGLRVVEVPGWETRGAAEFFPEGVTWHATAGSRTATAQGEVNVIIHGSTSAPPPIAQLMIWRDGTIYVCAAGRCNHNKVGWDGPNKGLGNSRLLGIEMANDNRGEPWPPVQLDAARRATAAIMTRFNADPMRRLAAHYEHQPYATRPPGEGSTKSDPHGVRMTEERARVAALMTTEDTMTKAEFLTWLRDPEVRKAIGAAVLTYDPGAGPDGRILPGGVPNYDPATAKDNPSVNVGWGIGRSQVAVQKLDQVLAALKALAGRDTVDEQAIVAGVLAGLDPRAIAAAIPQDMAGRVADHLAARLQA